MNQRGQTIVTILFLVGVGLLLWTFLAPFINYIGNEWAAQRSGLEAMLASNLNLVIGIGLAAFAMIGVYVTTNA